MQNNPFTPFFGEVPTVMAGRDQLLRNTSRAFASSMRTPELTMLLSGARGTGKTALLTAMASQAEEVGWVVANVTALPGMLDDIVERSLEAIGKLDANPVRQITSLSIGSVVGLEWEREPPIAGNWRTQMNRILDHLAKTDTGLLITVDEVLPDFDELRQLVATYQHFTREHRKVALLLAGLPYNISTLVRDKTVSFLRRAKRQRIGRVSDASVASALNNTARAAGSSIDGDAIAMAVDAIQGFPYMMQLVGYYAWEMANDRLGITVRDVDVAIGSAMAEMADQVFEATYLELSDVDLGFLRAMLADDGSSRMADIALRMNKSYSYAAQYRKRLLEGGIIGERGRGKVGFELPFFKEYIENRDIPTEFEGQSARGLPATGEEDGV